MAKKSHSAVNIISIVSVAGVAVATAAIVIVMSVFNGFAELASSRLSIMDPDAKVLPARGKVINNADSVIEEIKKVEGVVVALPVVEDRALAICGDLQMPVVIKGVPSKYNYVADVESTVIDGEMVFRAYGYDAMTASVGVAMKLDAKPAYASLVTLYAPKRVGKINAANPAGAFMEEKFALTGVFQVNQIEYDNDYVFIPIEAARRLFEYDQEATAIELSLSPVANSKIIEEISAAVGADCIVLTRERLEEKSFRMIMIEKWVTFLMLAFIVVIAAFNIISTLSLLVIEKRQNMQTMRALGADNAFVRSVFACQGWMITMIGGIAGVALGAVLSLAQQYGGFIKLSGDTSQLLIDVYPVRVEAIDLLVVFVLVAIVAFAASLIGRALCRRI